MLKDTSDSKNGTQTEVNTIIKLNIFRFSFTKYSIQFEYMNRILQTHIFLVISVRRNLNNLEINLKLISIGSIC